MKTGELTEREKRFSILLGNEDYEMLFKEFPESKKVIKNTYAYIGYSIRKEWKTLIREILKTKPFIFLLKVFRAKESK